MKPITANINAKNYADTRLSGMSYPKKAIQNSVVNGNFSNGTTGWIVNRSSAVPSVANNVLTVAMSASSLLTNWRIEQSTDNAIVGNKYYVRFQILPLLDTDITIMVGSGATAYITAEAGQWNDLSGVVTAIDNIRLRIYHNTASYQVGNEIKYKYFNVINLTATFGAGNEPTKEQMDYWINKHSSNKYINGLETVSLKESNPKIIGSIDGEIQLYNSNQLTSHVAGKKLVCFGDSITGAFLDGTDYPTEIAKRTGMTVYNVGFGGSRIGAHSADYDPFSFYRLVDAIISKNFQGLKVQFIDRPSSYDPRVQILEAIDFTTVDYITIALGTNDWGANTPDEGATNEDPTSFRGAARYGLRRLLEAFPQIKVLVISPFYRYFPDNIPVNDSDEELRTGRHLYDYVDSVKAIANEFKIPFLDAYYSLSINKYTRNSYFSGADGTHPDERGRKHIGNKIASKILSEF